MYKINFLKSNEKNSSLYYLCKHFSICDNINAIKYNYNNKYSQAKWQMCINSKSFSSQSSSTSTSSNLLNFFDLFPSSSSSAFYFIMFTFSTNNSFTSNTFDFWHLKVGAQHSLQSLCQIVLHIFSLFTILPNLNILKTK